MYEVTAAGNRGFRTGSRSENTPAACGRADERRLRDNTAVELD